MKKAQPEKSSSANTTALALDREQADAISFKTLEAELNDRIRFEAFLAEQSASFVNVGVQEIDAEMGHVLERTVEFLGVDRGNIAEFAEDGETLTLTHSCGTHKVSAYEPFNVIETLPWYSGMIRAGRMIILKKLPDDLPPRRSKSGSSQ